MKDIEQYLRENRPGTPSEDQFLIETNARLSQVEGIKQTVDGERRRGRVALVIALVVGLIIGCLVTLFVMFYPLPSPEAGSSFIAKTAESLREWQVLLFLPVAGCAIALGVLFVTRKKEAL